TLGTRSPKKFNQDRQARGVVVDQGRRKVQREGRGGSAAQPLFHLFLPAQRPASNPGFIQAGTPGGVSHLLIGLFHLYYPPACRPALIQSLASPPANQPPM